MLRKVFQTSNHPGLTLLRVVLGSIMFAHGAQKMLGWFGGYGFNGTMGFFTSLGIPYALGFLAIAAEFFGGLGLIAGLFGRIAAFGIIANMAVAAIMVHRNFFFMNWYGNQQGEGFEYHLLAIAVGLIVLVKGSGAFSLDSWLEKLSSRETRVLIPAKAA